MKVKILMMPLIIGITVAVLIWLVYPAYSNGNNGVKENYSKLKVEQAKLTELKSKSENISTLSVQLSSIPEKNVLYNFVPEKIKEEEIINDLVNLAANSGLLLFDSMVSQPVKESQAIKEVVPVADESGDGATLSLSASMPKMQNVKTEIKLAGNYEKIKDFLNNLEKFSRSNRVEILDINKNNSEVESSTNQDVLLVNATINFNVLKEAKLDSSSINSPIFDNSKLEANIISDIKNKKNASVFQLNVDQKGKGNIFQP